MGYILLAGMVIFVINQAFVDTFVEYLEQEFEDARNASYDPR